MQPASQNDSVNRTRKTSRLAVASFVLGLISLCSVLIIIFTLLDKPVPESALFIPSVITIVVGILAVAKIKSSSYLRGIGWAAGGMALASLPILAFLFLVILFVFFSDSINIPW